MVKPHTGENEVDQQCAETIHLNPSMIGLFIIKPVVAPGGVIYGPPRSIPYTEVWDDDTMRSKRFASAVLALLIPTLAEAEHRFEGKWTLNVAMSTLASLVPRVKRATRSEKRFGDGISVRWEILLVNGERQTGAYTAKYDGRPYPVSTSPPSVNATACAPISRYIARCNQFKDGTLVETYEQSVSADGKVLTLKFFAIPPDYDHPTRILIYNRH